ncbi:MAG: metallophosphoesterase family protein [Desulfurococcales archaeon]|nr:metallophosphoesterase family protein [Desulfurococcales archaeon]
MPVILHVTDIHCATRNLARVLRSESYDIVAATGDYECLDTVDTLLKESKGRLVAVTGNIDNASIAGRLRESGVLLDGRLANINGYTFAGLGGLDLASSIQSLNGRLEDNVKVDFLLSHHPPKGILDRVFFGLHAGSRDVARIVERLKPKAHLFGHIHEARGSIVVGGTLYVNAGPLKRGYYSVVSCGDNGCGAEMKRLGQS